MQIRPRSAWGAGLGPTGRLEVERRADVRFLLVHHTAQPGNDYGPGDVPRLLRGIYRYHTSTTKGWPDVAYNFFVDRYGGAWEGRTGSLQAPVKASATGGSQGFALLACFLGDHDAAAPTAAARSTMIRLLAHLAEEYDVDTSPGATTRFVSRGSSRWPRGKRVTTPTISGHRDMSVTSCPGRYAYPDVRSRFPIEVTAARERGGATTGGAPEATAGPQVTTQPSPARAAASAQPAASRPARPTEPAPSPSPAAGSAAGGGAAGATPVAAAAGSGTDGDAGNQVMGLGALVVATAAAVTAAVVGRRSSR